MSNKEADKTQGKATEVPPKAPESDELAALKAKLAESESRRKLAEERLGQSPPSAVRRGKDAGPAPGVVKGRATYLLKAPHYRLGEFYAAGEYVTVTDEAPSRTWKPVPYSAKARVLQPIPPKGAEVEPEEEVPDLTAKAPKGHNREL